MRKVRTRGFTLIEMLVVISIISLLGSIILTNVAEGRRRARDVQRVSATRTVITALEAYYVENGNYPCVYSISSGDGSFLADLVNDGYISSPPQDPINSGAFQYWYISRQAATTPSGSGSFISLSANGCGDYVVFSYDTESSATPCINGTNEFAPGTHHCHVVPRLYPCADKYNYVKDGADDPDPFPADCAQYVNNLAP